MRNQVTVFSSDSNTMGLGFQVLAAARAAKAGKDLDEILSILEQVKLTSGVAFTTPHIEYLKAGRPDQSYSVFFRFDYKSYTGHGS